MTPRNRNSRAITSISSFRRRMKGAARPKNGESKPRKKKVTDAGNVSTPTQSRRNDVQGSRVLDHLLHWSNSTATLRPPITMDLSWPINFTLDNPAVTLLDGSLLAPLFGASKANVLWLENCAEDMSNQQIAAILDRELTERPEMWHEGAHTTFYRAMLRRCRK